MDECASYECGRIADNSSDDSDDEDDTAALMAELARIKAERAEEKARLVSRVAGSDLFLDLKQLRCARCS